MGELRNAYEILGGKAEGLRQPAKPRRRCEACIKMGIKEMFSCLDQTDLAKIEPSEGLCECGNEHSDPIKDKEFLDYSSQLQIWTCTARIISAKITYRN
jgi:hypothetical protein